MKESSLIEMKNKIETMGSVLNKLIMEMNNLKTLSVGNMELLKLFPDYEAALEEMKRKNEVESDNSQGLENFDRTQ